MNIREMMNLMDCRDSYKGFRVDVGVPINSWKTPRLYLGLDIEQ